MRDLSFIFIKIIDAEKCCFFFYFNFNKNDPVNDNNKDEDDDEQQTKKKIMCKDDQFGCNKKTEATVNSKGENSFKIKYVCVECHSNQCRKCADLDNSVVKLLISQLYLSLNINGVKCRQGWLMKGFKNKGRYYVYDNLFECHFWLRTNEYCVMDNVKYEEHFFADVHDAFNFIRQLLVNTV